MTGKNLKRGDSTTGCGQRRKGPFPFGAAVMPIVNAATSPNPDLGSCRESRTGQATGHIYSRNSNPTVAVLEAKMAALDRHRSGDRFLHRHGGHQFNPICPAVRRASGW